MFRDRAEPSSEPCPRCVYFLSVETDDRLVTAVPIFPEREAVTDSVVGLSPRLPSPDNK